MNRLRRIWCRLFGHRLYMGQVNAQAWVKPHGGDWALVSKKSQITMCSRCDFVEPFTLEIAPPAGSFVEVRLCEVEVCDGTD